MNRSSDVTSAGQMKHLYSGAKSRVSAENVEWSRSVTRGPVGFLKMILSPGAKTDRKFEHGAKINLSTKWVYEFTKKIPQDILIPLRKSGYGAS
jgi:hypothetical protein